MSTVSDATVEVCKNIKLMEMLTNNTKNKFTPQLYTMSFDVIIKNFSKEFGEFLASIKNEQEW
jgi:hypothetical protein